MCAEKLSEKDRTLLRRRYEQAVPVDQLATELSMSRGAVYTSLYRLRRALHDCVEMRLQQPGMS